MSILFLVEGSPLSKVAGDLSIALAEKLHTSITAQFVVDPQKIFKLEGFEGIPGLCGSGVFIEAEENMIQPLTSLGETLILSFSALAEGHGVQVNPCVDIGSTAQEVERRAAQNSLLVLASSEGNLSIIAGLKASVDCPILELQADLSILLHESEDPECTRSLAGLLAERRVITVCRKPIVSRSVPFLTSSK